MSRVRQDAPGDAVTLELLDRLGKAWNACDVETVWALITDDCVWEASFGPHPWGERYEGKDEIARGLRQLFARIPDVEFLGAQRFACGEHAVAEWRVVGTRPDGTKMDVHGCDIYTLREGKIASKRAYRKALL
jgi:ketosteroid isomerase-like protein